MLPNGYVLYNYQTLCSTNDKALDLLNKSLIRDRTVITASSQTAGKGRNGKTWDSPKGNLYMTIVLERNVSAQEIGQLSFVTAVAIGEILLVNTLYKWPNDLLINDKKVCGILLESHNNNYVVVGIGLNITNSPDYATCLNDYGEVNSHELLCQIITNFEKTLNIWHEDGFVLIREKWLSKAWQLNKKITLRLYNKTIEGNFKDISSTGQLVLKAKDGIHYINSGEIYF